MDPSSERCRNLATMAPWSQAKQDRFAGSEGSGARGGENTESLQFDIEQKWKWENVIM